MGNKNIEAFCAAWKQNQSGKIPWLAKKLRTNVIRQLGRVHESVQTDLANLVNGVWKPSNSDECGIRTNDLHSGLLLNSQKEAWEEPKTNPSKRKEKSFSKETFPSQDQDKILTEVECLTNAIKLLQTEVVRNEYTSESDLKDDSVGITEGQECIIAIRNTLQMRKLFTNSEHKEYKRLIQEMKDIKHEIHQNQATVLTENQRLRRREQTKGDEHFDPIGFMVEIRQTLKVNYNELRKQSSDSREDVKTEELRKTVHDLKSQLKETEKERGGQLAKSNVENAKIRKDVKELHEKLIKTEHDREGLTTRNSIKDVENDKLRHEIRELEKKLKETEHEKQSMLLKRMEGKIKQLETEIRRKTTITDALAENVETLKDEIEKSGKKYEHDIKRYEETIKTKENEIAELKRVYSCAANRELVAKLDELEIGSDSFRGETR